jgi:hypothetical protein
MKRSTYILIACFFTLAIFLSACQNPITAQTIWNHSFETMQALTSVKTTATIQAVNSSSPEEPLAVDFSGALDGSGKSFLEFTTQGETGGAAYILKTGPDEYHLGSETDTGIAWQEPITSAEIISYGSYLFIQILNPLDDLLKDSFVSPILGANETIDGVACYHITLQVDPAAFQQLLFGATDPASVGMANVVFSGTADYWISTIDFRMLRSGSIVQFSPTGQDPATTSQFIRITSSIDYSAYNEPVTFPTP